MNTEELINSILPILQEKLNVPEPSNVLVGISDALTERSQAERFVPGNDRRTIGTFDVPETVQEVVSFPRLYTHASQLTQSKESSK
jgi:hypothetical protein